MDAAGYDSYANLDVAPERPTVAFALTLLAGLLMLIDGAIVLWASSTVASLPAGPAAAAASSLLGLIGGFAILFGLIVTILAIVLMTQPESHVGIGVTVLVFSLISFVVGGGFFIGGILGVIGGILAIVFDRGDETLDISALTPPGRPRVGEGDTAFGATSSGSLGTGEPLSRTPMVSRRPAPYVPKIGCANCGEIQPAANAVHCRKCGAELRPGPTTPTGPGGAG